jgi:hypothetical protein
MGWKLQAAGGGTLDVPVNFRGFKHWQLLPLTPPAPQSQKKRLERE